MLAGRGLNVSVVDDLEAAVRRAEIVSAATISAEPLIRGDWLAPGTHVDCVGAYRPNMRETDDAVVRRARIYVDTRPGAFAEAGDIVQPLAAGVIGKEAILGDLFELARGTVAGRGRRRRSPSSSPSAPPSRIWPRPLPYMRRVERPAEADSLLLRGLVRPPQW